jgi:hypothetical protein
MYLFPILYESCNLGSPCCSQAPQKSQNIPNFTMQKFRYVGTEV